jgi:hypothetical protein
VQLASPHSQIKSSTSRTSNVVATSSMRSLISRKTDSFKPIRRSRSSINASLPLEIPGCQREIKLDPFNQAWGAFRLSRTRNTYCVEESLRQQFSMLTILHAACATALDAFYAADNAIDRELVSDLEKMVERTRREIANLAKVS